MDKECPEIHPRSDTYSSAMHPIYHIARYCIQWSLYGMANRESLVLVVALLAFGYRLLP